MDFASYDSIQFVSSILCRIFFWGIIKSAFIAPAPHCQAMRWVIHNGGNVITQMWVVLGTWCCGKLCKTIIQPIQPNN